MKTNWVATLTARKIKPMTRYMKKWVVLFLLMTACAQNDDLGIIETDSLIENETIINNERHIIYTDIEPNFTSENIGDFYNLDLNNDGIVDFNLQSINSSELVWMEANANGINAMAATGGPFEPYILPLGVNASIANPYLDYYDSIGYLLLGVCNNIPSYRCEFWESTVDKYLGLRFLIKGQTHYGWARLRVTSSTDWVIKDYAYNATPNFPILAGQTE